MNRYETSAVEIPRCPYCGMGAPYHTPEACPSVKEIEYYQNGSIKRVQKWETTKT